METATLRRMDGETEAKITRLHRAGLSIREITAHPDIAYKRSRVGMVVRELERASVTLTYDGAQVHVTSNESPAELATLVIKALQDKDVTVLDAAGTPFE